MFDLQVRTYEPVELIQRRFDGKFVLSTRPAAGPATILANRVVLCTGGTDFRAGLTCPAKICRTSPIISAIHTAISASGC